MSYTPSVDITTDLMEFSNEVINWNYISQYKILNENLIEKYHDKVNWTCISAHQKLSEKFIRKYKDKVDWLTISMFQDLSEEIIKKFQNKVCWGAVSMFQKLSEPFIEKFKDRVCWPDISKYQKLTETFIDRNKWYVDWHKILNYQDLSESFIKSHNLKILDEDNWLHKSTDFKKQKVIDSGSYECYDDYFIAYKAIRKDRYSLHGFQYKYEIGNIYETNCDCTNEINSFGFNVGTYNLAKCYKKENSIVIKCQIRYEDVGRIIGNTIRCFKIKILS